MPPDSTTSRPLLALHLHNYQRLGFVSIDVAAAGLTKICGKNAQGKSAILSGAEVAMKGLDAAPLEPIRHGESEASIRATFGNIVIEWSWKDPLDRTKAKMTMKTLDGATFDKPQSRLNAMIRANPDPLALLRLSRSEQQAKILDLAAGPKLTGEIKAVDQKIATAAQRRRDAARDAQRAETVAKAAEAEAAGLRPVDAPDATEAMKELDDLRAKNEAHYEAKRKKEGMGLLIQAKRAEVERGEKGLIEIGERLQANAQQIADDQAEIQRIEQRIAERRIKARALEDEAASAHAANKESAAAFESLKAEQDAVVVPELLDEGPVKDKIRQSESATRAKAQQDQIRAGAVTKRGEFEEITAIAEQAETALQRLRDERAAMMTAIEWPSPGLTWDAERGGLLLNDVPFEQASKAQQISVAVDLATSQPAEIPLLLIRDGNDLDNEHLALVDQRCRERGWQALIELVSDEPIPEAYYVEDGSSRWMGAKE